MKEEVLGTVIQPSGVYKNLYIRPTQQSAVQYQPAEQNNSQNLPQNTNKKKGLGTFLKGMFILAALIGVVWGLPALGTKIKSKKTSDFISGISNKFLQNTAKTIQRTVANIGTKINASIKTPIVNFLNNWLNYNHVSSSK